jgi:EpsI family protein
MNFGGAFWARFSLLVVLLAATGGVLHEHEKPEVVPPRRPLSVFPMQIAGWQGTDIPLGQGVLDVLGPGEFLMRDYRSVTAAAPVNLFIAYFPSQRTGDTIHSPRNCLPGSGWTALESGRLDVRNADGTTMSVNRYIVAKGLSRALVLYWYQAHGRETPSEYVAKIRLVEDAMRLNRTDGAMVRIVVPFEAQSDLPTAQKTALAFLARIQPLLDRYIPR